MLPCLTFAIFANYLDYKTLKFNQIIDLKIIRGIDLDKFSSTSGIEPTAKIDRSRDQKRKPDTTEPPLK